MEQNPYDAQQPDTQTRRNPNTIARQVGTATFVIGLAALAYGVCEFWLVPALPPNNGWSGRLPSLYVMGGGIVAAIVGLSVKSLAPPAAKKGAVPTGLGLLIILAIVIA